MTKVIEGQKSQLDKIKTTLEDRLRLLNPNKTEDLIKMLMGSNQKEGESSEQFKQRINAEM